jgi:hypothetical protein
MGIKVSVSSCEPYALWYTIHMATKTKSDIEFIPVVPMDAETSSMLAYAASPAGRARIEKARQELRDGQGITVAPGYFVELKRRISKQVDRRRSIQA